jgi:integrase
VHDLRHSYTSLPIQAGESLAYVRDHLGHHSIKVTVDICERLVAEGNKAAVDRLDHDFPYDDFPTIIRTLSGTSKEKGVSLDD